MCGLSSRVVELRREDVMGETTGMQMLLCEHYSRYRIFRQVSEVVMGVKDDTGAMQMQPKSSD